MPSLNVAKAVSKEHWPDLQSRPPGGRILRGAAGIAILALMPPAILLVAIVQVTTRLVLWKSE